MKIRLQLFFALLMIVMSCASPYKSYDRGNFEKAYDGILRNLERGAKNRKDQTLLNKSFQEILSNYQTDFAINMRSVDIRDWERAYREGEELILKYLRGQRWLDSDFVSVMDIINDQQDTLASDIAQTYISTGDELIRDYERLGDKFLAQEAHASFISAAEYSEVDEELKERIAYALDAGTIFILFEAEAWDLEYAWEIDNKFQRLGAFSQDYVQVFFEDPVERPDCHVKIVFNRLDIDDSEKLQTDNYSKEVVDRYETVTDSTGRKHQEPVYKTVSASVECDVRVRNYTWEARSAVDIFGNYCDYSPRSFQAEYEMEARTYRTNGDSRALPEDLEQLEDIEFEFSDREIVSNLIDEIYSQLTRQYF